ncbi:MAG: hypothetical protein ACO1RX_19570 [Candidatus Sericytochromatia bacterium]
MRLLPLANICLATALGLCLGACQPEQADEVQASAVPSQSPFLKVVFREGEAFGDLSLGTTPYSQVMAQLSPQANVSKSEVSETACNPYPNCSENKYTRVRVSDGEFTFFFKPLKPGWTLEELPLEAVKVECLKDCAFEGLTGKGIRLGDDFEKVQRIYGTAFVKKDELGAYCYRSGICFDFLRTETSPKISALAVVQPNRLEDLK